MLHASSDTGENERHLESKRNQKEAAEDAAHKFLYPSLVYLEDLSALGIGAVVAHHSLMAVLPLLNLNLGVCDTHFLAAATEMCVAAF